MRSVGGLFLAPSSRYCCVQIILAQLPPPQGHLTMSPFRYRDDESSTGTIVGVLVGALAGFAAGMSVAQRVGGFGGLTSRIRERAGGRFGIGRAEETEDQDLDDYEEDEI